MGDNSARASAWQFLDGVAQRLGGYPALPSGLPLKSTGNSVHPLPEQNIRFAALQSLVTSSPMNGGPFYRRLLTGCTPFLFLLVGEPSWGAGLLILKGSNPSPEFARVLPFTKCERFAVSYKVETIASGLQVYTANEVFDLIEYDSTLLKRDLVTDQDFAAIQEVVSRAALLGQRYPALRKDTPAFVKPLNDVLSYHSQGLVQFRGSWIRFADYQAVIAKEDAARAEQDRKREEEYRDKVQRDRNLKSRPQTLAARSLLKDYPGFLQGLERDGFANSGPGVKLGLSLQPEGASLPLPKYKKYDLILREGRSFDSPAVLTAVSDVGCNALKLAVGIRTDGDEIANAADLEAAKRLLQAALPEIGAWLPLGVVSARTKLQFSRMKPGAEQIATVSREIGGRLCELTLTEPVTHDDGTLHTILSVTIR